MELCYMYRARSITLRREFTCNTISNVSDWAKVFLGGKSLIRSFAEKRFVYFKQKTFQREKYDSTRDKVKREKKKNPDQTETDHRLQKRHM